MGKIIRLTESQLKHVVDNLITEQTEEREFIKNIQRFLNYKKIYGSKGKPLDIDGKTDHNLTSQTAQAISKYQSIIKVYPADGVWGEETWNKMPKADKEKLEDIMAENGDIFDKFMNWISKKFR
jgi:peptidoglycan hydrolase-like protein with peptidoglycan-binding domain